MNGNDRKIAPHEVLVASSEHHQEQQRPQDLHQQNASPSTVAAAIAQPAGNDGAQPQQQPQVILREEDIHREARQPDFGVVEEVDRLTQLQALVEAAEWEQALERVYSHPDEILSTSNVGSQRTALHLALEDGAAPFQLIQVIMETEPNVFSVRDSDGNTPLHTACSGEHVYNPAVIASLIAAFPQALLMQDKVDKATPLHMLLLMGGNVDMTCLTMVMDVAYSRMAGLSDAYVPAVEFSTSPLEVTLPIASLYPPVLIQAVKEIAIVDPYTFPSFLRPFLHLPCSETDDVPLQRFEEQKKLLLMVDVKKQTPLHSACYRYLSVPVFRKLLNDRRYPGAHEATRVKERRGRLPLMCMAMYGQRNDANRLIFDLNPEAVDTYEVFGLLSHQLAYINPDQNADDRKLEVLRRRMDQRTPITEDFFPAVSTFRLYNLVQLFLRLTHYKSYTEPSSEQGVRQHRMVHAASACPTAPQMLRATIELHPWQVRERDEDGNLPLHLGAKQVYPFGNHPDTFWLTKSCPRERLAKMVIKENRELDVPIAILVKEFPEGAKYLDNDGCLPLHSAIRSGRRWIEGLKQLVSAAPLSLSTRDGQERLYPFMIAAAEKSSGLDEIFELLRADPMVIQTTAQGRTSIISDSSSTSTRFSPIQQQQKRPRVF